MPQETCKCRKKLAVFVSVGEGAGFEGGAIALRKPVRSEHCDRDIPYVE